MNSTSGGNFTKNKVSEAREILGRLIDAKKAYYQPRAILRRDSANAVMEQGDEKMEARIDLSAIEKNNPPAPQEKEKISGPEEIQPQPYYGPPGDGAFQAQVNSMGSWNLNGSWNPGKQKRLHGGTTQTLYGLTMILIIRLNSSIPTIQTRQSDNPTGQGEIRRDRTTGAAGIKATNLIGST